MDPLRVYDYLTRARGRVLDAVRTLTSAQYLHPFNFGLRTIGATLTHIMISEWYYVERLEGRSVPPYEQWPIRYEDPPTFEVVEARWRRQADRIRATIAAESDWNRPVTYTSFADEHGKRFELRATAGDFLAQLAFHEVHHRAQILTMLRQLGDARPGMPLENLDYNYLMWGWRELA